MHTDSDNRRERIERTSEPFAETKASWMKDAGTRAFALIPSELFRRAVSRTVQGSPVSAIAPLLALTLIGLALHSVGLVASARVLDSPASSGARRAAGDRSTLTVKLPGISAGASAVATNQLRLAVRTPRGRSILISPLLVFLMFLFLMRRGGGGMELGFIQVGSGLGLATLGSAACLLSILPFAVNQFAIDRAGLTMQFLSPLSDLDILLGKAVGNGLIVLLPAILSTFLARLTFPGGSGALWLSVPLALIATYTLAAPAAAAASAIFPREVDLNSIGSKSNGHGLAGLLGMLAFVAAAAPPVLLVLLATAGLDRPALAPVVLLIWCLLSALVSRVLLVAVSRLFHTRRENLALVA